MTVLITYYSLQYITPYSIIVAIALIITGIEGSVCITVSIVRVKASSSLVIPISVITSVVLYHVVGLCSVFSIYIQFLFINGSAFFMLLIPLLSSVLVVVLILIGS